MADSIAVEVVYAGPERQELVGLQLPPGSTLLQAVLASGFMQKFPEIDLRQNKVGIFGRIGKIDTPLREHDRVEIYRPLIADPKEVRRQRAALGKPTKSDIA